MASTTKRKRDSEYQYEAASDPSGPDSDGVTAMNAQGAVGVSVGNNHIENLLAQARKAGLLPATGPAPENKPPSSIVGVGIAGPNVQPSPYADPRRQQKVRDDRSPRNDTKRRKLDPIRRRPGNEHHRPRQERKPSPLADKVKATIAEALAKPTGPDAPSLMSLPIFPDLAKPVDYPPPIPPIHDPTIEQQCFTHPSYVHNPLSKCPPGSALHYERLEFLGDSYMNYCVTKILYRRLPNIREGELTRFRSQIISNENIRHYAMMYNFHRRMLISSGAEKEEARDTGKKVADIFEAYIGGILTDQPDTGEKTVLDWMAAITEPQIDHAVKIANQLASLNKGAKQDLYVLIDAEKLPAPTYVVTREGGTNSDYEVACLIEGKEMGRGVGMNKGEAGTRAAMYVLEKLRASTARNQTVLGVLAAMDNEGKDNSSAMDAQETPKEVQVEEASTPVTGPRKSKTVNVKQEEAEPSNMENSAKPTTKQLLKNEINESHVSIKEELSEGEIVLSESDGDEDVPAS
jgi:dsRNA-specific ribonuclease